MTGKKASQKTRRLLSLKHRGKPLSEEQKAKISATNKRRNLTFNRAPTFPQLALLGLLGAGWEIEHRIPVNNPGKQGGTTYYDVDLASPKLRLAIDVDGLNHLTKKQRDRDKRKGMYLRSLDWRLIRVTNNQAVEWSR
jgi:hypothetical protein